MSVVAFAQKHTVQSDDWADQNRFILRTIGNPQNPDPIAFAEYLLKEDQDFTPKPNDDDFNNKVQQVIDVHFYKQQTITRLLKEDQEYALIALPSEEASDYLELRKQTLCHFNLSEDASPNKMTLVDSCITLARLTYQRRKQMRLFTTPDKSLSTLNKEIASVTRQIRNLMP